MSNTDTAPGPVIEDRRRATTGGRAVVSDRPASRDLSDLAALWPYLKKRPGTVAAALVFLFLGAAVTLAFPRALGGVIDSGLTPGNLAALNDSFFILAVLAGMLALLSAARFYFVSRFGERVVADLRTDLYGKLLKLPPRFHLGLKSGEAVSRLTADLTLIETFFGSSLSIAARTSLTTFGSVIALFLVDWQLASVLVLVIPVMLAPLFFIGKAVRKRSSLAQEKLADAASEAAETLEAIELVQAYGRGPVRTRRFSDASEAAFQAAASRIRARALMTALAILVVFGGITLVLWLGARAQIDGELTGGELTQFVIYAVFVASGASMISEIYGDAMRASGAASRVIEILQTDDRIGTGVVDSRDSSDLSPPQKSGLSIRDLGFGFAGAKVPAVAGLSFDISPGQFVAVVGPSGAGKSTLFRLLLRLFEADCGQLYYDGKSAGAYGLENWRALFAYVPQETALFSESAASNIAFGGLDETAGGNDPQIAEAARLANAFDFLAGKDGLQTVLGPRGKSLSGGERQRLSLARALYRDAPILLLDEATSALDNENERLVQDAISKASQGRTTLVIAHRLSTVQSADLILVMDAGRIVEQGRHEDLIEQGGVYARLASSRFRAEDIRPENA